MKYLVFNGLASSVHFDSGNFLNQTIAKEFVFPKTYATFPSRSPLFVRGGSRPTEGTQRSSFLV